MKRILYTIAVTMLSSCFLMLGGAQPADAVAGGSTGHDEDGLSQATRRELARARRATAKYHDIDKAIEDGYVDINVFVPNMGYHYLKAANLDGTFDIERPELLVYALTPRGQCLRLVAVEYAVPLDLSPAAAPEGFTGDADHWHRNEEFSLWTLHAWVWHTNPDGVFAELNPRVR